MKDVRRQLPLTKKCKREHVKYDIKEGRRGEEKQARTTTLSEKD